MKGGFTEMGQIGQSLVSRNGGVTVPNGQWNSHDGYEARALSDDVGSDRRDQVVTRTHGCVSAKPSSPD